MCMGFSGPPYGVPIPDDVYDLYTPELQEAWEIFTNWWSEAFEGDTVSRSLMPEEVREAYELIKMTPIPGFEEDGPTGADSCFMTEVEASLFD